MQCGKEIATMPGISDAAVVMGTKSNMAILNSSGLMAPELAGAVDADLLIAVKAETGKAAEMALRAADGLLNRAVQKTASAGESLPVSLERALEVFPEANLALISVAGRYAGDEAMSALEHGLHVMIFSDNVSLREEIRLKKYARKKGLLVMGPDCGTAIVNGVPLAFANVVNRGDIGIVAAAGTGLQEVSCIISNAGAGVSQAIGTGGREVKKEVGGIMFVEAMKALADDANTRVILLISKPPDKEVLAKIKRATKGIHKPVVTLLIGARTKDREPSTLEEAALTAVTTSRGEDPKQLRKQLETRDAKILNIAIREAGKRIKDQKYVRGLFSGGTFCAEAQVLFRDIISNVYSNAPAVASKPLKDSLKSQKNSVIDLGEDEFTVGRPHPMIDYSLRNRRILEEAQDPETAVILLDVVLGHGAHPDPASELAPIIREVSRKVAVVCSVTGTDRDPQNRREVEKRLKRAGAIVMPSNAAACKLAGYIIQHRGRK